MALNEGHGVEEAPEDVDAWPVGQWSTSFIDVGLPDAFLERWDEAVHPVAVYAENAGRRTPDPARRQRGVANQT